MAKERYNYQRSGSPGWVFAGVSLLLLGGLIMFLQKGDSDPNHGGRLTVYCAAGIRLAVEEAAKQFEKDLGVKVSLEYANSGVLANRLKTDKEGGLPTADVYIPADYTYTERAQADGLTAEALKVATWKVVLGVKPGAGLKLVDCDDLLKQKISFVICEPLAGVGKKTKKMLEKSGHWAAVDEAKAASFPTVTEAALAAMENAGTQAAFVWDSVARQNGLQVIELPELEDSRANITVAVTGATEQPTLALRFARYLGAPEKGGQVFARHKYQPLVGDHWAKVPKLRVDCGGVNREAVEKTISEFKTREGCEVDIMYAGCGTLVGKMQTGDDGLPDIFMTCDSSYLNLAQSKMGNPFGPDFKVSRTRIVMLVAKGNGKGLRTLDDLAQSSLRIGVTDPKASTLGALSRKLFEETGRGDVIQSSIKANGVMADTAHTLIQTMEAGGKLDVAIVYEANIQHLKDEFDHVPLQSQKAIAIQNIAAKKTTPYPQLAHRLMEQIISRASRRRFEQLGFSWEANGG